MADFKADHAMDKWSIYMNIQDSPKYLNPRSTSSNIFVETFSNNKDFIQKMTKYLKH